MRAQLALIAVLAACYSPKAQPGAPCGPGGECPAGLACVAGICGGTLVEDAATEDDDASPDDAPIDAPADAGLDAFVYIPFGTATELTSLETVDNDETDPSITADKLTAVLIADDANGLGEIYIATRAALTDTFVPALLTELNDSAAEEKSPEISPDGKTIFFTSNRSGDYQIYSSTFTTSWALPTLRTDLSTDDPETEVAISPDGLTAAVVRDISGQPDQIYIYTRASTSDMFSNGTVHPELNVTTDIAAPSITNNAETVYLHANFPRNIFVAHRMPNGNYTTPVPVTELNTSTRDAAPFVLQTNDYVIFDHDGDIYEASR